MDLLIDILTLRHSEWMSFPGTILFLFFIALASWKFIKRKSAPKNQSFSRPGILKDENEILLKYGLTSNGFLPVTCVEKLPLYYNAWENIASDLPALNKTRKLNLAVENLPLLSVDGLNDEPMKRRAFIVLGMLIHSYINGSKVPWEDLGVADLDRDEKLQYNDNDNQLICEFFNCLFFKILYYISLLF